MNSKLLANGLEYAYWVDLIAFDVDQKEQSVQKFITNCNGRVHSIYVHIANTDFVAAYRGMNTEYALYPRDCSCFAHSEERSRQIWTNYDFKKLIAILHANNVEVYLTLTGNPSSGTECPTDFAKDHPYLKSFSTIDNCYAYGYNFAKRLKDGSFFEDHMAKKAREVMRDYGFDGLHISDIVTFPAVTIENGDYGDDLVEQFVIKSGITLPPQFPITNTTKKDRLARRHYIISNLRYEWSLFIAQRYGEFIKKLIGAVHAEGKKACLVNAWTSSPFEALYRFGIDYRQYCQAGADKYMFEDAIGVNLTDWANDMFQQSELECKNWNWRLMEKQGALKCCVSQIPVLNMTSLHDTNEQWDVIENAPNELRSDIARRSIVFYWKNGKLIPSCEGSIFCLADNIDQHTWAKVHGMIDQFHIQSPMEAVGFTALYDEDLYAELKEFISTRRHNAGYINYRFLTHNLPITARATPEELPASRGPLLITAEAIRTEELKRYLEQTHRFMIVAGYNNPLHKKPSAVFTCGEFSVWIYHAIHNQPAKFYSGYSGVSLDYRDPEQAWWPVMPRMDKISDKLFADVVQFVNQEGLMPYGVRPCDITDGNGNPLYSRKYEKGNYNIFTYQTEEKKYLMLVINNDHHFNHPFIRFHKPIKQLRFMGTPDWYKPAMMDGCIYFKLNNRSCELVEVTVE